MAFLGYPLSSRDLTTVCCSSVLEGAVEGMVLALWISSGYSIYRRDRESHGGGVLLAVSDSIPSKFLLKSSTIELIAIELPLQNHLIICGVYIPPTSQISLILDLFNVLDSLPKKFPIIILGDINLPDIDWSSMSASSLPSLTFCEKAFDLNLFQVITEPTHIQGNILDVVITNNPDLIYNITVDKSTTSNTKSDHYLITFNIYASKRKNKHNQTSCPPKSVPIYSKADTDGIASFFHHLSSRITLRSSPNLNINNAWNHIRDIFHSVTRIFVPHATPSSKSYPKWFTPEIRHKLNKLHTLRRSVKNHPTTHKTTRLAEEESSLQTLMADTKHQHELQLAQTHNSNPKQLLKYLNHLSKQNRIPTVL